MYTYADKACLFANNMYNVSTFHIRSLMTGLKKEEPAHRTKNERDVIRMFEEAVPALNASLLDKGDRNLRRTLSGKKGH